jgi:carboxypeptidase Q
MKPHKSLLVLCIVAAGLVAGFNPSVARTVLFAQAPESDVSRLIGALLGDTPILSDLEELTDRIGGRATGSPANLRAVDWSLARLCAAGVDARKESFTMPGLWLERSASAVVRGDGFEFSPRVAAMPFSGATPAGGLTKPLVSVGHGTEADYKAAGEKVRGAFALVETELLKDLDGLFREYGEAVGIEARADAAGAAGVVYVGSRPNSLLYRHNVSAGPKNTKPMLVMERDGGLRALRLLESGQSLTLTETLDINSGPAYESFNVIAEIPGSSRAQDVVLFGAHLDSWDLGTGTLDNGANAMMMIDIARQMHRLGLKPARTIRLGLWNGEEQGLLGSFGYAKSHEAELDRHVVAGSIDTGCGRVNGFFTNGRADLIPEVDKALEPVRGLGPFTQVNLPLVGTDNYDFMMQGVPNLVANQLSATYGPNYHARSDEFDKCDPNDLRLNAAIIGALVFKFAQSSVVLPRHSRSQIEALIKSTDLGDQMKAFGLWEAWADGSRGRK